MTPQEIAATIAENNKKIEDLKAQLALAVTEANRQARSEAIIQAKAKGDSIISEAIKARDNLVAVATAKGEAMVANARAHAETLAKRAEQGLSLDGPANPSRPRKARQMADGTWSPLGRGKPSLTWVVDDIEAILARGERVAGVNPAVVTASTTALGMAVALAAPQPVVVAEDKGPVEVMVLRGTGVAVERFTEGA